jgi:hypothetical protein
MAIIPSLLGFSLGGFAVFVGLSDEGFRAWLSTTSSKTNAPPFLSVSSTFVHFIIIQIISLLAAIVASSLDFNYNWPKAMEPIIYAGNLLYACIGYFLFLYAIVSMIAATLSLFRVVTWYQIYYSHKVHDNDDNGDDNL